MFSKIEKLKPIQVFLILVVTAILIRFPFFFRDYVDHDESTFILMGQAMADGHLPYLKLWDLKPPLVFYFFAGIIAVFGKSLIAIRLAGSIVVGLTGYFTFKAGNLLFDKKIGFFAGLLTVYLLSLFGSMQGVMSEHLAVLPLVAGLYLLIKKQSPAMLLLSGICFGTAVMFRLNMAYALLFVYAFIVLKDGFNLKGITKGILLTAGSFIVYLLTFLPYITGGHALTVKTALFDASIAYSDANFNQMIQTLPFLIGILSLCGLSWKYLKPKTTGDTLMLIIVMIIGQGFMFFKGGKINGHYLIQVFPFLAILFIGLIAHIRSGKIIKRSVTIVIPLLFILMPVESYLEIKNICDSKSKSGTFYNGEGITIPTYLSQKYGHQMASSTFFLNEHIGYWILNSYPPTALSTHPSNLFRKTAYPYVNEARDNPTEELSFILNVIKPAFIVFDEKRIPMEKKSSEYQIFQNILKTKYTPEKEFGREGRVKVFKLKN